MLNIGQIIYDYTNNRVVIFAGFEMLQNKKTGECHSETGFILRDGTFIHLKANEETPFKYTNISMDGKYVIGTFVTKCRCSGHFFGIIDGYDAEVKVWAKEAIEEVEGFITKHGLNIIKEKTVPYYYIGQVKNEKSLEQN